MTIPLQLIVGISQIAFDGIAIHEQLTFSTSFIIGLSVTYLGTGSRKKTFDKIQEQISFRQLYEEQNYRANELSKQIQSVLVENMKKEDEKIKLLSQVQTLEHELDLSHNETIRAIIQECEKASRGQQRLQDEIIENSFDSLLQTNNTDTSLQPFEAKYLQLRSQFEEKTRILDETRKELFETNERAELLQRKLDEYLMHEPLEHEYDFCKIFKNWMQRRLLCKKITNMFSSLMNNLSSKSSSIDRKK